MEQILKDAFQKTDADYIDARYEQMQSLSIIFAGRELESVKTTLLSGGHVRALKQGGMASMAFTAPEKITIASQKACEAAAAIGRASGIKEGLAPAPVVQDHIKPQPQIDPREVPFDDKKALLTHYADLIMAQKGIHTVNLSYSERLTTETFVNSEGSVIVQDILFCRLGGRIIAKDGSRVESTAFSIGYDADYQKLLHREEQALEKAKLAVELLKAESIKGGTHTVICDPSLGGVFIHEAFGHLAESDALIGNPSLKDMMVVGSQVGSEVLSVVDQGDFPGAPGSYAYDHEGVRSRKTYVVRQGKLVSYLHSRNSAYRLGGELTGNCRARDYRVNPIVRMSNIYIEQGQTPFAEMLASVDQGYYLCGGKGGQTMGDLFTFGAQYGYEIKNGQLGKMVSDINISGNVFSTLRNIVAVGNDFRMSEWGGCGKCRLAFYHMQMIPKSGVGSPHIKIKDVVIGGR